ncbi:hypothetical protein ACGFIV_10715 [Sphaerisporangium sp. NPDC049003]|uniref:hypothetical protein n=1 Tax=Sphaerisporangium sp. NPDC049003 TaxID=3364517 RepID=UPI003715AA2F
MGKLDGMDPKLVRDLLAEVGRAGTQMRTVESRITQLTSAAGLSVPATHRPAQVADAGDTLVKDVGARLVLLEKKEKQNDPVTGPKGMKPTAPDKQDSKAKDDKSEKGDKSDKANKDGTPTSDTQDGSHKQDAPKSDKGQAPKADKPDKDHTPKSDKDDAPKADKSDPSKNDRDKHDTPKADKDHTPKAEKDPAPKADGQDKTHKVESPQAEKPEKHESPKADQTDPSPKADKPDKHEAPKGDTSDPSPKAGKPDHTPKPEHSDRQDAPQADRPDKQDANKIDGSDPSPTAEKSDPAPKADPAPQADPAPTGDSTPHADSAPPADPAPTGDSAPNGDSAPKADSVPTGDQSQVVPSGGADGQLDTPNADNPNDIDTTQERTRVIDVDGVRVVEVTMKPPSAEHLHWLTQNMDKIPPLEQPVVVPPDGAAPGHPHADGPVGYIQPDDPSGSAKPSAPLAPDSGGDATEQGLAAPQAAVQPGQHVQSGVYAPGDEAARNGAYSGGGPGDVETGSVEVGGAFPSHGPGSPAGWREESESPPDGWGSSSSSEAAGDVTSPSGS